MTKDHLNLSTDNAQDSLFPSMTVMKLINIYRIRQTLSLSIQDSQL